MSATSLEPAVRKHRRSRSSYLTFKDRLVLGGLIGFPTLLHILFVWIPAILTILLGFTEWDGVGGLSNIHWVGFKNYQQIFTLSPDLPVALRNNLLWLGFFAIVATPLGVLCAYFVDKNLRGTKFYQTAFYMPLILSLAVTGIIWTNIFTANGLANSILGTFSPHLGPNSQTAVQWFGNPNYNIYVVLGIASWRHIGYVMLLYLAGLKAVDPSLREAGAIDGASEGKTFRQIIFPSLKPINVIVIVITIIESLRAFDLVYIINKGENGLQLFAVLVYNYILGEGQRIGWGAALATILFLLCIAPIGAYLYNNFKNED
jgi:multiple sugar transport system permease protein